MPRRVVRDDAFLSAAMRDHGASVLRLALSQTGTRADAEDVYQDVFMALACCDTVFASAEHLRAWLLRVTVNRCRELWRTPWRRRVESTEELAQLPAPDAPVEDEALAELRADPVWQALQALPEKLRVVALLHYVEEYTTEEIVRIVGSPPATVRTRLHRARKQMRETLESPASPAEEGHYGQAHA